MVFLNDAPIAFATSHSLSITVNTTDPQVAIPFNLTVQSALSNGGSLSGGGGSLQTYLVDNDGNIQFPVVGRIQVAKDNKDKITYTDIDTSALTDGKVFTVTYKEGDKTFSTSMNYNVTNIKYEITSWMPNQNYTATTSTKGKVERSHRNDQERFYNYLSFYSFNDLQKQMKRYLYRANNIPMAVLGWKSPNQRHRELGGR